MTPVLLHLNTHQANMENSIEDLCLLENNQLGKTYTKRIFPGKSFKNGREQVESRWRAYRVPVSSQGYFRLHWKGSEKKRKKEKIILRLLKTFHWRNLCSCTNLHCLHVFLLYKFCIRTYLSICPLHSCTDLWNSVCKMAFGLWNRLQAMWLFWS